MINIQAAKKRLMELLSVKEMSMSDIEEIISLSELIEEHNKNEIK